MYSLSRTITGPSPGVVDDSETSLNPEQRTWTFTACIQSAFLIFRTPPSYACFFALFLCTLLNGELSPSPYHYSYTTTHHIIIHTSPPITPCHISHLIISCHTIYFITPTPTHSIPKHWIGRHLTVETFGLIKSLGLWIVLCHVVTVWNPSGRLQCSKTFQWNFATLWCHSIYCFYYSHTICTVYLPVIMQWIIKCLLVLFYTS